MTGSAGHASVQRMNTEKAVTPEKEGDDRILLALLGAVARDRESSQRAIAQQLGVALGMVNTYVKRAITKGYIKVTQAPANRYLYYLTPQGLTERARLAGEYLSQSLTLFRQARGEYSALLAHCAERGWTRVVLAGHSEMAEIAKLYAPQHGVTIVALWCQTPPEGGDDLNLPVTTDPQVVRQADAVLITDIRHPVTTAQALDGLLAPERILTPSFLPTLEFRTER